MLYPLHYTSLPLHIPSIPSISNQKKSIFSSGLTILGVRDDQVLGLKKSRRNGSLNAVEKDSEFEVDPVKAREALRKLDEQLQSLSEKKINPPKIRAADLNRSTAKEREEIPEISGSFLAFLASGLLILTILYNIFFLTIIKPSVDGPEPIPSATMVREAQEGEPQEQLSTTANPS